MSHPTLPSIPDRSLADDILDGAEAIAAYIFGDISERRRVYYMIERGQLPVVHTGRQIIARKSQIDRALSA